ncbi:hypothetical protein HKK72_05890 [Actinomadura sp. HBU206391]|nr:hypothetical protein [Actinomadura sp. HBU206391]
MSRAGTDPRVRTARQALRRRAGLVLAAITGTLLLLPSTAGATLPTAASPGDTAKVDKLTSQIKKLEKQYRGELQELRDSRLAAKRALSKSDGLKRELIGARSLVAQIAAAQYMTSGIEPSVVILTTDDPSNVLDGATMANHLSNNYSTRVKQIETLIQQEQQSRKEAKEKIAKLERTIGNLNRQRANVQKLINKYKPESPLVGASGLTARTVNMRTTIDREFGPFPTIGCLRPGDPGEHGSGRACDFMESTGGSMPSAARQAHGDQVAAYAIANASRLGIMYVIWKQRIYDMRSPGWKMMENRGGITANHFDHVHISMF